MVINIEYRFWLAHTRRVHVDPAGWIHNESYLSEFTMKPISVNSQWILSEWIHNETYLISPPANRINLWWPISNTDSNKHIPGACTSIPQSSTPEKVSQDKRACGTALHTALEQGIIWVWAEPIYPGVCVCVCVCVYACAWVYGCECVWVCVVVNVCVYIHCATHCARAWHHLGSCWALVLRCMGECVRVCVVVRMCACVRGCENVFTYAALHCARAGHHLGLGWALVPRCVCIF